MPDLVAEAGVAVGRDGVVVRDFLSGYTSLPGHPAPIARASVVEPALGLVDRRLCSFWSIVSMTFGLIFHAWHASQMIREAGLGVSPLSRVVFMLLLVLLSVMTLS